MAWELDKSMQPIENIYKGRGQKEMMADDLYSSLSSAIATFVAQGETIISSVMFL